MPGLYMHGETILARQLPGFSQHLLGSPPQQLQNISLLGAAQHLDEPLELPRGCHLRGVHFDLLFVKSLQVGSQLQRWGLLGGI